MSIKAGFWWHVGYFLETGGARRDAAPTLSWNTLNFYHLTTDPIPYRAGFRCVI